MSRISGYSPELRERAVRMVVENRKDCPSEWAAFTAIAKLSGMSPETLRTWVRKTQVDEGFGPGITSDERARFTVGLVMGTGSPKRARRRQGRLRPVQLRREGCGCAVRVFRPRRSVGAPGRASRR